MKNVFIALLLVGFLSSPALAKEHKKPVGHHVTNVTNVTEVTEVTEVNNTYVTEDSHNAFDFGAYLDAILFETPSTEWGIKTTYLAEGSETRVYAGGKIYLNRLLKKK